MRVRIINYLLITSIVTLLSLLFYNIFSYESFVSLLEKFLSPDNHLDRPMMIISMAYTLFLYFIGVLFLVKSYINGSKNIVPAKIEPLQYIHYGVIIFIIGIFFIFGETVDNRNNILFQEDGFFENFTVVLTLISTLIFFYLGVFYKAIDKKIFLFLFAILLFFYSMEEISWGQRIFDWKTPENLIEINYQNEINVHNIFINPYMKAIYFIFFLFVSSLFTFRKRYINLFSKNKITKIISDIYPSNQYFYAGFIYLFIAFSTLKIDDELSENLLTVTIFIYSLELLCKKINFNKQKS